MTWLVLLLVLALPGQCIAQSSDSRPSETSDDAKTVDSSQPAGNVVVTSKRPDFNTEIYYKNKLEFSVDTAWLPINIPFVFDFLVSDNYDRKPLSYTLAPTFLSLRWQTNNLAGPWFLRGNWDLTSSGSATIIPRGPETRYFAYDMGIRRNFVQRNWRVAPYFEFRAGVGDINAKGPEGVRYAQGQDLTFTIMLGSGFRYNFNPTYSLSAGVAYMHVSNAYLSEPRYEDYGINVYGPMIGFNMHLGHRHRE